MKAKVSEQDLTDYALNELGPEERIYVETVLAGSEEAREDVYQMIDLAMMLDEGFEKQQSRAPAVLTVEQRRALLSVPAPNIFLRNSVAALAAAACVAVAFIQRDAWMPRLQLPQATASSGASAQSGMQASASSGETDFVSQIMQFRQLTDDPLLRKWFQSLPGASSPAPAAGFDASSSATLETLESLMP
jgi:anti-sigma factor RsiW